MATYGTYNSPGGFKLTIYGIVIVLSFFILLYATRSMYRDNNPGRVNSARAAERIKARNELRTNTAAALQYGGNIDTNRGLVRIPIARAMQMTVEAYQNPAQARSNLIARAQKAAEPLPQPSFE